MTDTHAIAILNAAGQILVEGGNLHSDVRDACKDVIIRACKAYDPWSENDEASEDVDDNPYPNFD